MMAMTFDSGVTPDDHLGAALLPIRQAMGGPSAGSVDYSREPWAQDVRIIERNVYSSREVRFLRGRPSRAPRPS
jgi:hypothetical protein